MARVTPIPDAGATVVVVAGGTGVVGSEVVRRLVADGLRVVVPTRHPETHEAPFGARLVGVDWEHPTGLRDVLAEPGWRPRAAVAALGGWWIGPQLVDVTPSDWRAILDSHLTAHWLAVRALAPVLVGPDPAYVLLGGAAATDPMPGSGPINVTGAAQRMLMRVLRAEEVGRRVRFAEVNVRAAVRGDERNLEPDRTVAPREVADAVARVLAAPSTGPVVEVTPG